MNSKKLIITFSILCSYSLLAQGQQETATRSASQRADVVNASNVSTFEFSVLNQSAKSWRVFIRKPDGPPPTQGYPVLYLLDGNVTFPIAWKIAEDACQACDVRNVLIVGVGYPTQFRIDTERRMEDFLPSRGEVESGESRFLSFLATDLRNFLGERFKVDKSGQTLFGHSFGGLFTLRTLTSHPDMFNSYVVADPSYWWNDGSFLTDQERFISSFESATSTQKVRVLLEQSSEMRTKTKKYVGITSEESIPQEILRYSVITNARALSSVKSLKVFYRHQNSETHNSMIDAAIEDALNFSIGATPSKTAEITIPSPQISKTFLTKVNKNENTQCKTSSANHRHHLRDAPGICTIPERECSDDC